MLNCFGNPFVVIDCTCEVSLSFRNHVACVFSKNLVKTKRPSFCWSERHSVLSKKHTDLEFSGHLVEAPGRHEKPRKRVGKGKKGKTCRVQGDPEDWRSKSLLAKFGQNIKTQVLAKFGHDRELAKFGKMAQFGTRFGQIWP